MDQQALKKRYDARVCIIGGGGTGAALAYDLALRGLQVILLEHGEFTSGTTGRHHGQLHCGARYAVKDAAIARECMEESLTLRRIVPQAIEYNGGMFVAVTDADADYAPVFIQACLAAGIPARELTVEDARAREPGISQGAKKAVWVPDGTFDAFRVPLSFLAAAKRLGADLRPFSAVTAIEVQNGRVRSVRACQTAGSRTGMQDCAETITADYFISATGAWAARTGLLAGLDIPVTPAPGAMVAIQGRITDMVISRLAPPGDGDIIVPQRGLSIIGSTQRAAASPEGILPTADEIAFLLRRADEMMPGFSSKPIHAAWAAARPLAGRAQGSDEGRSISRDFMVLDHQSDGVGGFATLIGGKATVLRAMAEKAADHVCSQLGISEPCRTKEITLPSWRDFYAEGRQ